MHALVDHALAAALASLGHGPMLPFALFVGLDGAMECLTIATDASNKALFLGRRLVRAKRETLRAYAIVTDAYVRREEQRVDAIIVEVSARGQPVAWVGAQPYRIVAAGEATWVGERLSLGSRPSELEAWDPHTLDWGDVAPDLYNEQRRLAAYVVNHDLQTAGNVQRTLRFLRARLRHHRRHLPQGAGQMVIYDDRGQLVRDETRRALGALPDGVGISFLSARSA